MSGIAITGSASGIGLATREHLEAAEIEVVGIDIRDAEVIADLGTPVGRATAIAGVMEAC